jgi:hypothetical protein
VGWSITDGNDQISFGVAPISSGYVQDDAGYWTLEREKSLTDLCVLGDSLYIFAPDNIYIFRGYSPETFLLSILVANMGIKEIATPRKWLTVINNICYFYNNGNIYEFNGSDYPRLISHPVYVNGALTNSIMGGIADLSTDYALASDNDKVYVYLATTVLHDINNYYTYYTKQRTWWKHSGFTKHNSVYSTTAFKVIYVTKASTDSVMSVVSVSSTAGSWDMHTQLGHKGLYNPYIITKAFNSNPSDVNTLTAIILQMLGDTSTQSTITLSYSLSATADDFETFKILDGYDFTEDIENVEIPVSVAYISNAHPYRIKIQTTDYVDIYNIERRFRVKGRTR